MIQEETTAGCEASILHFEERDESFRITRPGQRLMSADERRHNGGHLYGTTAAKRRRKTTPTPSAAAQTVKPQIKMEQRGIPFNPADGTN